MSKNININSIKKVFSPNQDDLNKIIKENPKSAVYKLALPTLLSLLFLNIDGLMDNMWVAGLGPDSLAGVGFILPIFTIIISVGNGLGVSTNALLSSALSNNDNSLANKITANSLIVTLITSIIITLILVIFLNLLLSMLNVKTALGPALEYGYILFGGMFVFFFASVVPSILKARGDVMKITYAMVSTSFLNIILDPILIYNLNLGIKGAAIATVFCSFLCCIILSYFIFNNNNNNNNNNKSDDKFKDTEYYYNDKNSYNKNNLLTDLKHDFKLDLNILKDLVSLSIPITLESFVLSILGLIFTMLFNLFGTTMDVAIFTIIFKVYYLAVIPVIAISSSAVTISAYLSNSFNLNELKDIVKYMIKISMIFSVIIWIIILFLNDLIVGLFSTVHTDVIFNTLLGNNMRIMLLIIIPLPIGLISTAVLQGLKLGKISFVLSVIRSILLEVIFSLIFIFVFHLGTLGIYYGIVTGVIIGSLICFVVSNIYSSRFFKNLELNMDEMEGE